MHYLIDGYNLLFRTLRGRSGENLKEERNRIAEELGNKLLIAGIEATLIFDSYYQVGPRERFYQFGLDVHYTDEKQTADEYILEGVRHASRPQDYIVVTSDRGLARRAAGKGAKIQTIEAFKSMLQRIYIKKLQPIPTSPSLPLLIQPKLATKIESSLERYERLFEVKLEGKEERKGETKKKAQKAPIKKVKKPKEPKEQESPPENQGENDYERWLKAFTS